MQVVFHADDFGLTRATNAGIVEAHRHGVLGSTSLMVTAGAADDAMALARAHPSLDVGLHLTLVEEEPALPPAHVPTLVAGGRFLPKHPVVALRYLTGRWRVTEAVAELDAQWARAASLGLAPSHVDGHQHLHLLPALFPAVVAQARRHGVRFVRSRLDDPLATAGGVARRAVLLAMRGVGRLAWARVPAADRAALVPFATVGFVQAGGAMTVDDLLLTLEQLRGRADIVEVMLHPGRRDADADRRYGHWNYRWENDLELLTDPRLRPALAARGIVPTSFRELAADG